MMAHRLHIDWSMEQIGLNLFGPLSKSFLQAVRPVGRPVVDNWACLKSMVRTFEKHCGSLSQYGMKHMRAMANICNAGISEEEMAGASEQVCGGPPSNPWSSLHRGFSA